MADGHSAAGYEMLGRAEVPVARHWQWPERHGWGKTTLFLLTAAAYASGSALALLLIDESGLSSVFFIPAGISVGFLLRLPRSSWWPVVVAVAVTEATMDALAGYDAGEIAAFSVANTIEPVIGAAIVTRMCGAVDLARIRHVWWFIIGAVVAAPAVGAAVGAAPAHLLGESEFAEMFPQWWLGDALGVLLIGSVILVWGSSPDRRSLASTGGAVLVVGTFVLTVGVRSFPELPLTFLVLIGVVVAGSLFGVRAVAVTGLIVASTIALGQVFGLGLLLAGLPETTSLIILKLQLAVFAAAGLVVAAEAQEGELATARAAEARALAALSEQERVLDRQAAIRLQRALLPDVPGEHEGVEVAARYEAGGRTVLVGGDWYDVFDLPDGSIGLTVGDVVGHGLEASAAMGRLRTAVAVLARLTLDPGRVLAGLDEFVSRTGVTEFATAGYAILNPSTGVLRYASAGHPPMLLVSPDGATQWLAGGRSAPLCGMEAGTRDEAETVLEAGSVLVAYSDGLVERRGEDLEDGLARLEDHARRLVDRAPGVICDSLVERLGAGATREDDVVVLVLRYTGEMSEQAEAG